MLNNRLPSGLVALPAVLLIILTIAPNAQAVSEYKVLHAFGKAGDGGGFLPAWPAIQRATSMV